MDLYERLRRERRKEHERVTRRCRIGGALFVVALLVLHRMSKGCGYDLFGWDEYRRCPLPEIGNWPLSDAGASWMFWTVVIVGVAVLVARFQGESA